MEYKMIKRNYSGLSKFRFLSITLHGASKHVIDRRGNLNIALDFYIW